MSSVHNIVETVNAAATAIVTAESRVQPSTVQKKRWGSCWSIYSCFGSYKQSKKIGPTTTIFLSEPSPRITPSVPDNQNHTSNSSSIIPPFIAPPSSPASFLQSDSPSATYSPTGLGPPSIFAVGPYAHELTQLVSPPVFSTFTTEPSTASFTPQMTTPSSPVVPLAQLLSSSLAQNRRSSGPYPKLSGYDFRPYLYPRSPDDSPGSAVSTSGTSSPFPHKFCSEEAPKPLPDYENYSYNWDSRVGSGSLTPNKWGSRLGSGALTPLCGDNEVVENRTYEVTSIANNSERVSHNNDLVDYRVSFEIFGEDIPTCIVRAPSLKNATDYYLHEENLECTNTKDLNLASKKEDSFREHSNGDIVNGDELHQKHRTISLGSSKDFNFNNEKGVVSEKSSVDCEWWTNEKVSKKELGTRNSWSFFPMLNSEAS